MIRRIAFIIASFFCLLNIILWPVNKYEWMLDYDPDMSLPMDSNAGFYALFALLPILLLPLFIIKAKDNKQKQWLLAVFSALLVFWCYKFGLSLLAAE